MCGPLNRRGRLCSRCKAGYGIPVFSKTADECVKCDFKYAWPLYLSLVLLPLTFFYFLVIIFNFSATHPPISAFTFYCQLFVNLVYNTEFTRNYFDSSTNKAFQILTWTVSSIWNLDMFRSAFSWTTVDALLLKLISALYPMLLIFLTLFLIEMHAHNVKPVVFLWKPFHRCFPSLRRAWDPRSSAFATFLFLSSFKICFITFDVGKKVNLYLENGTRVKSLYLDP
jgi:hypothetical protein